MRPHGHVIVNPSSPEPAGECQRCSAWYNLNRLNWQYEWSGNQLINTNLRFCPRCMDVPQPQLKTRMIEADPVSVLDARPSQLMVQED